MQEKTLIKDGFDPFRDQLDLDASQKLLRETLQGADDGEIFFERTRGESLSFDDNKLKSASYDATEGFGMRAVSGEVTGYAHSTDISSAALQRAAETARLAIGHGGGTLAVPPQKSNNISLYSPKSPLEGSDFASRVELLREIDAYARSSDPDVVQLSVSLAGSFQEVVILRPDMEPIFEARPLSRLSVSVIVERNGRRESGSTSRGGRYGFEKLLPDASWKEMVHEALRIAKVNLNAEAAPAGTLDVVLGAGWPGILLHEAIGHGLEGDHTRRNLSAFSDRMGQRIAAPGVTVFDDGTLAERRGSITIDDEGTPSQKTCLIEDGILTSVMMDRQNARLGGIERSTGNGRRQSYAHPPMVRMTNTYMAPGAGTSEEMISELKDGLWAVGFGGGQVDITSGKFVFSCTEAYRVKNGKIGAPVKGATLIGDGPTALQKIRAVGSDFELDPGMGTCGKQGQWVPVGVGQPSLLIGGLTVGGSEIAS